MQYFFHGLPFAVFFGVAGKSWCIDRAQKKKSNSLRVKLGKQGPLMTFYLYRVDNDQRRDNILLSMLAAELVEAGKLPRYHKLKLSI